jgi:ABC-type transport system involved in cytochrome c biogenesis permease component
MMITLTLLLVLIVPYFAPAIVAFVRGHQQKWAIFALDLFLGWTFLGWVGALVWSLTKVETRIDRRRLEDTFR